MRDIVDAIRYLTHNGPVWWASPADFPPAGTVYWWLDKWQADGAHRYDPEDVRLALDLEPDMPIIMCDAQQGIGQGSADHTGRALADDRVGEAAVVRHCISGQGSRRTDHTALPWPAMGLQPHT
jgi:hypothetical protein